MTRQESFEQFYADQHDVPVETMAKFRWIDRDGYRLPGIASAYRSYCAGWDAQESLARIEREFIFGNSGLEPKGLVNL
jgi:hypothetical protein